MYDQQILNHKNPFRLAFQYKTLEITLYVYTYSYTVTLKSILSIWKSLKLFITKSIIIPDQSRYFELDLEKIKSDPFAPDVWIEPTRLQCWYKPYF